MPKNLSSISRVLKPTLHLLLLAISLTCANTSGILPEDKATSPPVMATGSATVAQQNPLTFFMHDIVGGSTPSERIVSGNPANRPTTQITGLPFAKPNGRVFPPIGGIPLAIVNNNGNNNLVANNKALPFVTAGQLPQGASLQQPMFGTITVIDNELTEGRELGSSVLGKAQGFHLASSLDGSSRTMAFTTTFGDDGEDSISFFGVHRTAERESHVAVVGGTGKYKEGEGYAIIETLHLTNQHTTDGVETLLHISVFLNH